VQRLADPVEVHLPERPGDRLRDAVTDRVGVTQPLALDYLYLLALDRYPACLCDSYIPLAHYYRFDSPGSIIFGTHISGPGDAPREYFGQHSTPRAVETPR